MKAQISQPQAQNTNPNRVGVRGLHVLAAIVLSLALSPAIHAADWTSTLSLPVYLPPAATNDVAAMAEFGGDLFVGVGGFHYMSWPKSAAVLRLSHAGCKQWDDVTPPFVAGTAGDSMAMAVFAGQLYVGTDEGELFRTPDGQQWKKVTGYTEPGDIISMAQLGSYLYVNNGGAILRSSDGAVWTPVVGPSPAKHSYSFGEPSWKATIESFITFNGSLWAGVGRDTVSGLAVWTSSDGVNWSKSLDVAPQGNGNIGTNVPSHVHAMQAYKGQLYVATYHGNEMYRTDGVTGWKKSTVPMTGDGDMLRMTVHNNTLYLGRSFFMCSAPTSSDYLLYSSTNGTTWSPVAGSNLGAARRKVTSMLSSGGNLWVGFYNDQAGAEVFAYGQVSPCQISDLGKSWENGGKGKAELPKSWIDLCKLGKCPRPLRKPQTIMDAFAAALRRLELPDGAQHYQQEALEQMEIVAELVGVSAELQQMAASIEDPGERMAILDEASHFTAEAMAVAQAVTESIAAAAGRPSPTRFADHFEAGIDGWSFEGGFAPTELNGEGVLAGEGWSIATAECEPAEDQTTLMSFRARLDGGRVMAQAASTDRGAIWVGLQDGQIVVATSERAGEEPHVIAAAPWSAEPDAWQLIQAEVDRAGLSVSVNTHQVLSVEIGAERQAMAPAFFVDGCWAAVDDVALAGWNR